MIIAKGYDGKPTHIKVNAFEDGRMAELWIDQKGLFHKQYSKSNVDGIEIAEAVGNIETLAYITLDELLNLREEVNQAIRDIVKT